MSVGWRSAYFFGVGRSLVLIWTFLVVVKLSFRRGEKDDVLKLPQKKEKCGKLHINAVEKFVEEESV